MLQLPRGFVVLMLNSRESLHFNQFILFTFPYIHKPKIIQVIHVDGR